MGQWGLRWGERVPEALSSSPSEAPGNAHCVTRGLTTLTQDSPVSLFLPTPGVLQVLLPELLALAAQHGGPAPPQPPDAEPEEPRFQLEERASPVACGARGPAACGSGGSPRHPATDEQGAGFPGQGKTIVTFALAESVFVSALINAQ